MGTTKGENSTKSRREQRTIMIHLKVYIEQCPKLTDLPQEKKSIDATL